MLAWIALNQAIDANQNPCPPGAILQHVNPLAIDISLPNAHATSVADGLRSGKMRHRHFMGPNVALDTHNHPP